MQVGLGFWASKTLLSAVEMRLFTELARRPDDLEALRRRLGLHERSARDFLDALVALGMLERQDGVYRNTAATDLFLDRDKPTYVGGILEMANHRLYGFWGGLTEALRTGQPQNEAKGGGVPFFEALYADPARLREFLAAMTGLSHPANVAIAEHFPWGGYGTLRRHRHRPGRPRGAGRARPPPPDRVGLRPARGRAGLRGLRRRARPRRSPRLHPGRLLRRPAAAADVVTMGHILHDWDLDAEARRSRQGLRRRSRTAAR